jgi:hypothetical protein
MVTTELRNQLPATREVRAAGHTSQRDYRHWTWGPFPSAGHRRAANRRYAAVDG